MVNLTSISAFSISKKEPSENEDSILLPKKIGESYVFAIADGVGKYCGAKIASLTAIEHIDKITNINEFSNMKLIFEIIKTKLIDKSKKDNNLSKMATTLTICIINNKAIKIAHTGDCRVYINERGKLVQKTKDQTEHEQLISIGSFTKEELISRNRKNVLFSALSPSMEVCIEENELSLKTKQVYLMSDGAYHSIENKLFDYELSEISSSELSVKLENYIRKNKPIDDSSLIAVTLSG